MESLNLNRIEAAREYRRALNRKIGNWEIGTLSKRYLAGLRENNRANKQLEFPLAAIDKLSHLIYGGEQTTEPYAMMRLDGGKPIPEFIREREPTTVVGMRNFLGGVSYLYDLERPNEDRLEVLQIKSAVKYAIAKLVENPQTNMNDIKELEAGRLEEVPELIYFRYENIAIPGGFADRSCVSNHSAISARLLKSGILFVCF